MTQQRPTVIDRTGSDIHAELAALGRQGPVALVELPGAVKAWSVTGYEAALQVLGDPRFSKDPRKHWLAFRNGEIGEDFPLIGWVLMDNLTTAHGSDHSRLRRLTASAFTPRRVEAMRPVIEQATAELLDDLAAVAPGEAVDLKRRFAHPLAGAGHHRPVRRPRGGTRRAVARRRGERRHDHQSRRGGGERRALAPADARLRGAQAPGAGRRPHQ